jgi:raffinose synthase
MVLRMESGDEAVLGQRWPSAVLVAAGDDPFALVDAAVAAAAARSGDAKPLAAKRLPPSLDVFGWCSWDAFYSAVSAQGLTDAVASLAAGGVPPRLVIIDDGWQVTDLDSQFKGWQEPAATLLRPGGGGAGAPPGGAMPRESYIEGEAEMISAVLRDIPAGSSTGVLLQEVKAAEGESLSSVDFTSLAQQHNANAPPAPSSPITAAGKRGSRRRRRPLVVAVTGTLIQYGWGLVAGTFQALVILFYQWVVDPAADGTWPVRFFTYLAEGPLRAQLLQFYADQTNFTRRLTSVRANAKFHAADATPDAVHTGRPDDLAAVVAHLRGRLDVRYVYCWHGLSAYWSGVSPEAPAMARYAPQMVYARPPPGLREIEPSMLWNPSVLGGVGAVLDPSGLFHDMHAYLAGAGVTGVKVDCQAGVGMVGSVLGGGPTVAARYHAALEDSVAAHFPGNDAINCMAHSTENIYRWRDTAVARASDDFYPSDYASHAPHLAACAYNGLFLSALAQPDW